MSPAEVRTPGGNRANADQITTDTAIVSAFDPQCTATATAKAKAKSAMTAAQERLLWCDSYSRMDLLFELYFQLPFEAWLELLGSEWTGCDNIGLYRKQLRLMLPRTGPVLPMMDEQERSFYDALPDRITIYRGCGWRNVLGASWSLDREVAAGFPSMNRYYAKEPLLVTATVRKSQVLAVKLEREESEVITFAARRINIEPLPVSMEVR